MKTLFILNDPPYGTERSYNALRLAGALAKRESQDVRGIDAGELVEGAHRSTLEELADWTVWADKVLVF
jgi:uncharacterized protein involved in oxidation of intracellular sulfur